MFITYAMRKKRLLIRLTRYGLNPPLEILIIHNRKFLKISLLKKCSPAVSLVFIFLKFNYICDK